MGCSELGYYEADIITARPTRQQQESWDCEAAYRVEVTHLRGHDEMRETFEHIALFSDRRDAEALLARVNAAMLASKPYQLAGLNLRDCWVWSPSVCSTLSIMHEVPTAKLSMMPLDSRQPDPVRSRPVSDPTVPASFPRRWASPESDNAF